MIDYRDSTGREVCDLEFDGKGKETYIAKATYLDDGSDVPEHELDFISDGVCFCLICRECA
jgi:hypothetical protein